MEEFDKYKELKYISVWFIITSITLGIAKLLGIESSIYVYIVIIVILGIYAYQKTKEAEHYKKQLERKNGKKK